MNRGRSLWDPSERAPDLLNKNCVSSTQVSFHGAGPAGRSGVLSEGSHRLVISTEVKSMVDSTLETLKHSRRVDELILQLVSDIQGRITKHDLSKMEDPERAVFDEYSPKLKNSTYGSEEYKGFLVEMKVALDHHYANNRHHPEHFEHGVDDMTLVDLVEMLSDWKASTERTANGDLERSLEIQRVRFGLSDQLVSILRNTAKEAGWLV